MQISIANYRGCKSATFDPGKITLIAGKNHSGKSSVKEAISAAVSEKTIPIDNLTKKEIKKIIHDGAKKAIISVSNGDNSTTIEFPTCKKKHIGAPFEIDGFSAGVQDFTSMNKKEKQKFLSEILKAEPTIDELRNEIDKTAIGSDSISKIIATVEAQGWDAGEQLIKETGTRAKGMWEATANTRYGTKIAAEWEPVEWDPSLYSETEETLSAVVDKEKDWLRIATTAESVAKINESELQADADKLQQGQSDVDNLTTKLRGLFDNQSKIRKDASNLPVAKDKTKHGCPHCHGEIEIVSGVLVKFSEDSPEQKQEKQTAIDECRKSLDALDVEILNTNDALVDAKTVLVKAKAATRTLDENIHTSIESVTDSVSDCQSRLSLANTRLLAFTTKKKAAAINKKIMACLEIVALLSPAGLRHKKMVEKIAGFVDIIETYSKIAGWEKVEIDNDLEILYGGRRLMLRSKSEVFRVKVLFQIAINAGYDSKMILIDETDMLDATGRNGMFKLLIAIAGDVTPVVFMTINKIEDVPPVEKFGGIAYWIDGGMLTPCLK